MNLGKLILTTFFTLARVPVGAPAPPRQSSGLYGLAIITASSTMIPVPSHLVGSVLDSASKISCASLPTPFPLRLSASFKRSTAASAREVSALVLSGERGGCALVKGVEGDEDGGRERSVKFCMVEIGRIWYVEAGVVEMAMRLVIGQAVKTVPSRLATVGLLVVRRMLQGRW